MRRYLPVEFPLMVSVTRRIYMLRSFHRSICIPIYLDIFCIRNWGRLHNAHFITNCYTISAAPIWILVLKNSTKMQIAKKTKKSNNKKATKWDVLLKVGLVIETLNGALKGGDEGAATKGQGRRRSGFRIGFGQGRFSRCGPWNWEGNLQRRL